MIPDTDVSGPDTVEEGSTTLITIKSQTGSDRLTVHVLATGDEFDIDVKNGEAQFELPAGATARTTILVYDPSDPTKSHTILVVPGSTNPR